MKINLRCKYGLLGGQAVRVNEGRAVPVPARVMSCLKTWEPKLDNIFRVWLIQTVLMAMQ